MSVIVFGGFCLLALLAIVGSIVGPSESSTTTSSASPATTPAPTPDPEISVTGPSGMVASANDDFGTKLKGMTVAEATEYGRLASHAFSKDARRTSLSALDSINEVKRLKGERELTESDIAAMNFAAPMAAESRSMIAQKAANAGVPVEVRNAFFDGWDIGVSEVRQGKEP